MESGHFSGEEQYDHLKLHLKALEVGLWDYDIDADELVCDSRWYHLLALKRGSVRRVEDFKPYIHPEDVAIATEFDLETIAGMIVRDQRYHVDFRVIRSDGQMRWWRSVACLLIDGDNGHRKAIGCVTDTTEFRQIDLDFESDAPSGIGGPEAELAPDMPQTDSPAATGEPAVGNALTSRELECLSWVSLGKTARETAAIMYRSQRTVEFHLVNAVRKLSATNKVHAAVIAVRQGLI